MMYRIGVDVGGTFTDLVAVDDFGKATLAKVPSTPEDPSLGVLDGLKLLAETLDLALAALLAETERVVHGTTVATNALLEHKGARVGLLTTEGTATLSRCAKVSNLNATTCACLRRSRLCRDGCGFRCASGCELTDGLRRRSTGPRW